MDSPAPQPVINSLSVGPKGQKSQLDVIGSMTATSGAHPMSSFH